MYDGGFHAYPVKTHRHQILTAYYNEIDPYAAQWLRNLVAARLIAPGEVDERSIKEVRPSDITGRTQCHWFAGIGGWSYALRLAGWPDERPVWTGSCPCQPFSRAGFQKGFADPRHLWPAWRDLIRQCRPATIFGEQVAAASDWLNLVRGDLEEMAYPMAAVPMEAASAGADHFRDRYWFVAYDDQQLACEGLQRGRQQRGASAVEEDHPWPMADRSGERRQQNATNSSCDEKEDGRARRIECEPNGNHIASSDGEVDEYRALVNAALDGWGEGWTEHEFRRRGFTAAVASIDGCQYVECPDGKWRRLPPPRVRWLGNGIPARVAKLRAIGNAIDPRPAAEFIGACLDCQP